MDPQLPEEHTQPPHPLLTLSVGTAGTRPKNRLPRRTAWVTAAVLSSLGIAWGAPVVPTSSGLQTLQKVYDYENSQLTKDYNQLFSVSQPSARRQLSAQEIAWIQEKRAACGTVAKAQQSTQGLGCLIQHTDQRIVQIRQQEYGPGSNGSPAASPTTSTTAPTASTTSAVFLAPCPTPGTSASGGINWNSMQSIEQYFKTHETAAPHPASAACPAGSCCVKTSALPEQQAAQTQCTPAAAPTASTKSQSACINVKSSTQVTRGYKTNFLPAAESVRLTPYTDSLGNCTVGIGHLIDHKPCIKQQLGQHYSLSQVDSVLQKNLDQAEACVRQNMKGYNMSSCEFDALTDRSYNSGCSGAQKQGFFSSAQNSLNTGNYAYIDNAYNKFINYYDANPKTIGDAARAKKGLSVWTAVPKGQCASGNCALNSSNVYGP